VNSALDAPTIFNGNGDCTQPALGYEIPTEYLTLLGLSTSLVAVLLKTVEVLLVLHPVSADLSLLVFVQALFLKSHGVSICALIICILTAIVSSVTLAADIALVVVAKQNLKDLTAVNFEITFGNGVWMVVAAVALTWIAVVFLSARACYCCGVRSSWQEAGEQNEKNVPNMVEQGSSQVPIVGIYGENGSYGGNGADWSEQQSTAHGTTYQHEGLQQEREELVEGDGQRPGEGYQAYTLHQPQYAGYQEPSRY